MQLDSGMHVPLLRTEVSGQVRILYGGSVNGRNVSDFLKEPDIDGALIGGASLRAEEFISMYNRAKA